MITLFQYPPTWGLPCTSPFCTKVETFLRMGDLPYEVKLVRDPRKAPKGKLPFIRDGDMSIADSELILDHLRETHGADLDAGLSPADRAAVKVQVLLHQAAIADNSAGCTWVPV